jgi:hypothetical protein
MVKGLRIFGYISSLRVINGKNRKVLLHALPIDKSTIKFTPFVPSSTAPRESESDRQKRLLGDFLKAFPAITTLTKYEAYLKYISLNREALDWHKKWNELNSEESSAPDWVPSDPKDLAEWVKCEAQIRAFSAKEIAWQTRIKKKSDELANEVRDIAVERKDALIGLNNLVKINKTTASNLPEGDQLDIANAPDKKSAKDLTDKKLKAYREKLYKDHKGGTFVDPFM